MSSDRHRRESLLMEHHHQMNVARGSPVRRRVTHVTQGNPVSSFTDEDLLSLDSPHPSRRHSLLGLVERSGPADNSEELGDQSTPKNPVGPTASHRRAQVELLDFGRTRRSRDSFVAVDYKPSSVEETDVDEGVAQGLPSSFTGGRYGTIEELGEGDEEDGFDDETALLTSASKQKRWKKFWESNRHAFHAYVEQIPAIAVTTLLVLMVAVPFGVAYFPIGWTNDPAVAAAAAKAASSQGNENSEDNLSGPFPLPGKEALGIRMALFATLTGQLVMTFFSNFENPVAFQLLENVPFYHALAHIVIDEVGYGKEALSTLFFLFGLSSIMVGLVFYTLGSLQLGRVSYYFPAHVLVGCIGGIGAFIALTSVEVTNNESLTLDLDGLKKFLEKIHLYSLVIFFEITLRILSWLLQDEKGQPRFRYLAPIYFCSIVPIFYIAIYLWGVSIPEAREMGYLFPDPACSADSPCDQITFQEKVFNGHVFDIFKVIHFRLISWTAVVKSIGTLVALTSFSLIHVPINIPAFAVSSGVDIFMDKEMIAHGYSNILSGLFGGLQNVMTYSFSVLFMKSGGRGVASCLTLVVMIALLFVYGPAIAVYFPRCMAGTLLLHIGLDLFLEGVYDSYGNFDMLEYTGIWVITIVMTTLGMTAALLAGIIAALSVYAFQSIQYMDPIFKITPATTLRSSAWDRSVPALALLDDENTGRARILIVQLQGHLFFGNIADLTDSIKFTLNKLRGTDEMPYIVILDFSLVVGMDSSAAHAIAKVKDIMHRIFGVEVTIFVSGSHRDGFPCEYALAEALSAGADGHGDTVDFNDVATTADEPSRARRDSVMVSPGTKSMQASQLLRSFPRNRVCNSLDEALEFAEDILIARENPSLLDSTPAAMHGLEEFDEDMTEKEEKELAAKQLEKLVSLGASADVKKAIAHYLSKCKREEYKEKDIIWKQGAESVSAKLLVVGRLEAFLDGTDVYELVHHGNMFGELGLVDGSRRLTTVQCVSHRAVVYSLDRRSWEQMLRANPQAARIVERIAIRNLAQRVQHVSNRIFETRCLPI